MGLFSEDAPTAKFSTLGDEVSGVIVDIYQQQRTEYKPIGRGPLMYWYNGKPTANVAHDPQTGQANDPVMDVVILLDTGIADASGETLRRLFVKGKSMTDAIKAARRAARASDIEKGGHLSCKWSSGTGGQGGTPKGYTFVYKAPVSQTAFADSQNEDAPF